MWFWFLKLFGLSVYSQIGVQRSGAHFFVGYSKAGIWLYLREHVQTILDHKLLFNYYFWKS